MIEYFIYIIVFISLVIASVCDIRKRIIPNLIPCVIAGAAVLKAVVLSDIKSQIIGFVFAASVCALCIFFTSGGLGLGDAKLMSALGALLGFSEFAEALFITCIASGIVAAFLLVSKRIEKDDTLPFAPFILVGVVGGVLI